MLRLFNFTLQGVYVAFFLGNILLVTVCYGNTDDGMITLGPSEQNKIVIHEGTKMRSESNEESIELLSLSKGTLIKVSHRTKKMKTGDQKSNYWYLAETHGTVGWVFGNYIKEISNNLPKDYVKTAREKLDSDRDGCFKTFEDSLSYFNDKIIPVSVDEGEDKSVVDQLEKIRNEALSISLVVGRESETYYKKFRQKQKNDILQLEKKILEIPVKRVDNVYMIPVKINGKTSLDFIFDTLNDDVIIPRRVFDELDNEIKLSDSKIELPASLDETCRTETEGHVYLELEVNGYKVDHKCLIVNYDCCVDYDMCNNADTPRLGPSFLRKLGSFSLLFSSQ